MILKPFLALSIILNLIGFNLSAGNTDQKVADSYSRESYSSAMAADQQIALPDLSSAPSVKFNSPKENILSKEYVLVDGDTGKILSKKSPETHVPIASTTKIMTSVIALENYQQDDVITVPGNATLANPIIVPTIVNLRVGEKITVSELLHCALIQSGNDSAFAIASEMDPLGKGDVAPFVVKMNAKAKELGMDSTHYVDPAGLSPDGYSSAHDLSIITRYALQNPIFRQIVITPSYVATNTTKTIFHQLTNSNRLVTTYQYPGAIGVKTGFTDDASHCLVGAAKRNGHTLIAVILGTYSNSNSASADEARKLLDFGFANVSWNN